MSRIAVGLNSESDLSDRRRHLTIPEVESIRAGFEPRLLESAGGIEAIANLQFVRAGFEPRSLEPEIVNYPKIAK